VRVEVHNSCAEFDSYRAARVKSLFNAESGANFRLSADLPVERGDWRLGVIVGPSGSGKTSLGRQMWGAEALYQPTDWPGDKPIVDAIAPQGDFNDVTGALAAVGLGTVPTWLRPYPVLSNGEQFRANLARLICEAPQRVVVDEFTSVVDRQIAKFGALAFQKAWRRAAKKNGGEPNGFPPQCVLLSCHYDILEWVEPDWIFDTATGKYSGRSLRRPSFELALWQTDWRYWPLFEPHHYLKLPRMIAAQCYVGTVDDELVSHLAVSTRPGLVEARACRLVVMPEWQGAGVGLRFLNAVCEMWRRGENRYEKPLPTLFHTSHPGLCAALRRDPNWVQVSANLYGGHKGRSRESVNRSAQKNGWEAPNTGYGGHFRAVQGFRYLGAEAVAAARRDEKTQ
jgi:GNAT superfamily N-acetyltransferase